jgi:hypothetical protein
MTTQYKYTDKELFAAIQFFKTEVGQSFASKTGSIALMIIEKATKFSEDVILPDVERRIANLDEDVNV